MMNSDIEQLAKWATDNGWDVSDDSSGYTHFRNPEADWIGRYPATPSNPRRRMADLTVALKKAGLPLPPPSKSEQRSIRKKGQ